MSTVARRRRSLPRMLVRGALLALGAWLAVSMALVLLLRWVDPTVTMVMLQEPGPLGDLERQWVDGDAIARTAARAVIAAEDQRFFAHRGIDFVSLEKALQDYRDGEGLRGASTITQQVAKNVFLWQGRSFVRKALEAYFALLIEFCWTKERILEVYLNSAEFGQDVFGVEAASRRFFGRSAAKLDPSQAALLAAVLPNPKRYSAARPSAYVRERQRWIAGQMRVLETRGHYRGLE